VAFGNRRFDPIAHSSPLSSFVVFEAGRRSKLEWYSILIEGRKSRSAAQTKSVRGVEHRPQASDA
jgi:hypothetical protein